MVDAGLMPPCDLDAEAAVMASVFGNPVCVSQLVGYVEPKHFYAGRHVAVMTAIFALQQDRDPIDIATVASWLQMHGKLAYVGGMAYLTEILNAAPIAANVRRYAETVREHWVARETIQLCHLAMAECYAGVSDPRDYASALGARISALSRERSTESMRPIREAIGAFVQGIRRAAETGQTLGLKTGISTLDDKLGGLHRGELIIIAGRPGMGKTSLATCLAASAGGDAKHGAVTFSLEMPGEDLAGRMVCGDAGVLFGAARDGHVRDDQWAPLTDSAVRLSKLAMWIDDRARITVQEMSAKCRIVQAECENMGRSLRLVVVDYLQLTRAVRNSRNREAEVAEVSRELKELAMELKVSVIALSQLNRKVEERPDKRPLMSDLRESGAIENDADKILMIYREDAYDKHSSRPGIAEVIISKNRNGPTGTLFLRWLERQTAFRDLSYEELMNAGLLDE